MGPTLIHSPLQSSPSQLSPSLGARWAWCELGKQTADTLRYFLTPHQRTLSGPVSVSGCWLRVVRSASRASPASFFLYAPEERQQHLGAVAAALICIRWRVRAAAAGESAHRQQFEQQQKKKKTPLPSSPPPPPPAQEQSWSSDRRAAGEQSEVNCDHTT